MGLLTVLLQEENLLFSKDHLRDIRKKASRMNHRGKKQWYDDCHIALSRHCSGELNQPYHFHHDRYILIVEGLITNLASLHSYLVDQSFSFTDSSQEEILANLYIHKKTESFSMIEGAFVLLIWDREEKVLVGARDRFGKKQLYYTESDAELIFASEKKSLLFSHYDEQIDDYSFYHYLDFGYVPEPNSLTKGIKQVKRGHYFIKRMKEPTQFIRYDHRYFPRELERESILTARSKESFQQAVESRLMKGKPYGLLYRHPLSTAALGQVAKNQVKDLRILSIDNEKINPAVRELAEALTIDYSHIPVTPDEFMAEMPKVIWLLDDPFASPVTVGQYFLYQWAKENNIEHTISDLGYEAIAGDYGEGQNIFSRVRQVFPRLIKKRTDPLQAPLPLFEKGFKQKLLKKIITVSSAEERFMKDIERESSLLQRQFADIHAFLPGNKLRFMEKLSSSQRVTLLTPFLDEQLFELLRNQTEEEKRRRAFLRAIVSEQFSPRALKALLEQPMNHSELPIERWLREDCYEWAQQLIEISQIDDLMSKKEVLKLLKNFKDKRDQAFQPIWTILVFVLWHLVYVEDFYSFRDLVQIHRS